MSRRPRSNSTTRPDGVSPSGRPNNWRSSTTVTTRPRRFITPVTAAGARGTRVKRSGGTTTSFTAASGSPYRSFSTRKMTCRTEKTFYQQVWGSGKYVKANKRTALPPRPAPVGHDWAGAPVTPHDDGTVSARLCVDGLRCASCVWVTERVLQATPGVTEATAGADPAPEPDAEPILDASASATPADADEPSDGPIEVDASDAESPSAAAPTASSAPAAPDPTALDAEPTTAPTDHAEEVHDARQD